LDIKGNHSFVSSTLAKDAVTHWHNNWDLGFINKKISSRFWTSSINRYEIVDILFQPTRTQNGLYFSCQRLKNLVDKVNV